MVLKVLRLKSVSHVLKTRSATNLLRDLTKYKARKMTDKQQHDDKMNNHTHIVQLVYAHQIFKILESYFNLVFISFFLGVLWFILCEIQPIEWNNPSEEEPNFIDHELQVDKEKRSVILTYFLTTTLATVGFGDYHPVSDFERILGSALMLGGVAVFSIIFGQATNSMQKITSIIDPLNENRAKLHQFFGVMQRFNGNKRINPNLQR